MQSILFGAFSQSRRSALTALGSLAAGTLALDGAALAGERIAARKGGLDYENPEDNLYAFGKLMAGYGDKPAIGGFFGMMYLRSGDKRAVPVFNFTGLGITQARLESGGTLCMKSRECALFTDLRTGEVLEHWDNPFTGERVGVYHFYDDALISRLKGPYMPRLKLGAASDAPTLMNEGTVFPDASGEVPLHLPFRQVGADHMMLSWDYTHEYTNPVTPEGWPGYSTGARVSPSEHFTYNFSRQELEDRSLPSIRYVAGFSRISQPWPFMRMGHSPMKDAHLFGRMWSTKSESYDEVPRVVMDYLEKHAPKYLEAPPRWGEPGKPNWNRIDTWKTFALDIPPETAGYPWKKYEMAKDLAPPTGLAAQYYR
jgi:hypothetical protein